MVSASLLEQVEVLPAEDRLDLMGRLWDSLDVEPAGHELREARLGLDMYRADPTIARDCDNAVRDLSRKCVRVIELEGPFPWVSGRRLIH